MGVRSQHPNTEQRGPVELRPEQIQNEDPSLPPGMLGSVVFVPNTVSVKRKRREPTTGKQSPDGEGLKSAWLSWPPELTGTPHQKRRACPVEENDWVLVRESAWPGSGPRSAAHRACDFAQDWASAFSPTTMRTQYIVVVKGSEQCRPLDSTWCRVTSQTHREALCRAEVGGFSPDRCPAPRFDYFCKVWLGRFSVCRGLSPLSRGHCSACEQETWHRQGTTLPVQGTKPLAGLLFPTYASVDQQNLDPELEAREQ